jgi:hypothetical protein
MYWFTKRDFVYFNLQHLSFILQSVPFNFVIFVKEL